MEWVLLLLLLLLNRRQWKYHSCYSICLFANLKFPYKRNLLPSPNFSCLPCDMVRRIMTPKTTASKHGRYRTPKAFDGTAATDTPKTHRTLKFVVYSCGLSSVLQTEGNILRDLGVTSLIIVGRPEYRVAERTVRSVIYCSGRPAANLHNRVAECPQRGRTPVWELCGIWQRPTVKDKIQ